MFDLNDRVQSSLDKCMRRLIKLTGTRLINLGQNSLLLNVAELEFVGTSQRLAWRLPQEWQVSKLVNLRRRANTLFDEFGVRTLFLSLGVLQWQDKSQRLMRSPLVLVPVQIKQIEGRFVVSAIDEPVANAVLSERLRLEYGFVMPALHHSRSAPEGYLGEVALSTKDRGWHVTPAVYLELFNFAKFPMYEEVRRCWELYVGNPLVRRVLGDQGAVISHRSVDLNNSNTMVDIYDADTSQTEAIEAAVNGENFGLDGPPGAGKSQTIANIIARMLGQGKTVLFVSEKRAALEVVLSRLHTAGLKDFCLDLHSQPKAAVYTEIRRVRNKPFGQYRARLEPISMEREHLRRRLDTYARDLHRPIRSMPHSPFDAIGLIEKNRHAMNQSSIDVAECDLQQFQSLNLLVSDLSVLLTRIGDPSKHPWRDCMVDTYDLEYQGRVETLLKNALTVSRQVETLSASIASLAGITFPSRLGEYEALAQLFELLKRRPAGVSRATVYSAHWFAPEMVNLLLSQGELYSERMTTFCRVFPQESLAQAVALAPKIKAFAANSSRFANPAFWYHWWCLHRLIKNGASPEAVYEALDAGIEAAKLESSLLASDQLGRECFGELWLGGQSDWPALRQMSQWVLCLLPHLSAGALQRAGEAIACGEADMSSAAGESSRAQRACLEALKRYIAEVCRAIGYSGVIDATTQLHDLSDWLDRLLNSCSELKTWHSYLAVRNSCQENNLTEFVETSLASGLTPDLLADAFVYSFFSSLLSLALKERPSLQNFDGALQDQWISQFAHVDKAAQQARRSELIAYLERSRSRVLVDEVQELALLDKKLAARSRSVRGLLAAAPSCMRALKPCMLMSPLSVSQYLDPNQRFDLVIFDEGSQVLPEDALPAILRGVQVVVVGDRKQLGPTSFFSKQTGSDEDANDDDDAELRSGQLSVVDLFAAAFPMRRLVWHYRSKHESLIRFSNRHFYGDSLFTLPSPDRNTSQRGLRFKLIDGVYEGEGTNSKEARAVAEAIIEHARSHPERSLGVATFGSSQQELILLELQSLRAANPKLEPFFEEHGLEPFFVKPIELIMGDERDDIFISCTFGPDKNGSVRLNLGPISKLGGERRLNVLLSRAKHQMVIFACLRGSQIDEERCKTEGVKLFREMLLFAEQVDSQTTGSVQEINHPFHQAVYDALTAAGLKLIPHTGSSSYQIDFAVLDSEEDEQFLCGIELDGPTYARLENATTRDRLVPQLLGQRGWKLIRIWSLDWMQNPSRVVNQVLQFVNLCRQQR